MNETILQFGAGNFLRAFVDLFVQEMNEAGKNIGKIVVVQSTEGDRARLLNDQGGRYHVLVRGLENGESVERVQVVESISRALMAQTEWEAVLDFVRTSSLRAIVSNTTEAGMALDENDRDWPSHSNNGPPLSYPARLLVVLRAAYTASEDGSGVTILPCELIDDNAQRLLTLALEQADIWGWQDEYFTPWLRQACTWANTLVDRIVSGKPSDHPLLATDPLLTVTEPYQFWAIEDRPGTAFLEHPAIHRVPDVRPFSVRKVRILNGTHTALVAYCRKHRPEIQFVREAINDPEIGEWMRGLLFEEIVPTIEGRVPDAHAFACQTLERFANPFLDHRLEAIALHHDTKIKVRLIPTRDEYVARFGKEPARLQAVLEEQ